MRRYLFSCPRITKKLILIKIWNFKAIRELQEELHTEIYPGTEIMIDVGSHHFVKAGTGTHSVLVPQPSDDEHDPLVCDF
jgi:hypothetical protein